MKKITFIRTALIAVIMAFAFVSTTWGQATLPVNATFSSVTTSGPGTMPTGFTQSGLGGYAGALKFDTQDDWLQLNFSGTPGSLSFALGVNNTFPGTIPTTATFTIQESVNGTSWTTLGAYSNVAGGTKTLTPASASRYIRWYYTTKPSGTNISLKSITLAAGAAAPVVTAASPTGTVGTAFSYSIVATGTPTSYAVSTGTLPAGLSLNTGTGAITGTPTAAGSPVVGVKATNGSGPSAEANLSFTINKGAQSITFGALPAKTTADADFAPGATSATSGINAISYSSSNTAVATIVSNQIHIVGVGTSTITASQSGSANYNAATSVDQNLTVTQFATPQTITFNALSAKTYGDSNFDLTASSTSGLTISYSSSNTAVATVSGATVTVVGPGTTTITASQAGSAEYNPATSVPRDLVVNVKPLTVSSPAVTSKTYDGTTTATITGSIAGQLVGSDVVTLGGTGVYADANVSTGISVTPTYTLGGANAAKYSLTQPTGLTGDITKADQTITFAALPSKSIGDAKFKLTATASSSLTLTYVSSNLAVATIVGDSVTIVGEGTVDITASQAGNGNYNAATDVIQPLTILGAPILAWQFGTPASAGNETTYNATSNNSNLNTSVLSRGAGIVASTLTNGFSANTWDGASKASAVTNDEYYTFAINAKADYKVSLTTLDVTLRRSSTGPNAYIWKYSLDGTTFTEIGSDVSFTTSASGGTAQNQIDLSGISELQSVSSTKTITFRLYAWGATGAAGSLAIGKTTASTTTSVLTIGGSVVSIPTGLNTPTSSAKIYASKGLINVTGATSYSVYNAQGVQIANVKAADKSSVSLQPGIYIVKADGRSQKVMVK
ncbi:MAG: beta strand repeat-containing protein [Bacteroidales bacterium]